VLGGGGAGGRIIEIVIGCVIGDALRGRGECARAVRRDSGQCLCRRGGAALTERKIGIAERDRVGRRRGEIGDRVAAQSAESKLVGPRAASRR